MVVSIRRYALRSGEIEELAGRVDRDFVQQLEREPGFESYEFLDCGNGEVLTMTVFADHQSAMRSVELARAWTEEHLRDFAFTRLEPLAGEIVVSRAAPALLEPQHGGAIARFASVRRYTMAQAHALPELVRSVDDVFADEMANLQGFVAYQVIDWGSGELAAISIFDNEAAAAESDEMAMRFVAERLSRFGLQRTELISGRVLVSRAVTAMLESTHA
jgi:hypothetical protein